MLRAQERPDYDYLNTVALTTLSRGYLREGIAFDALKDAAIARINAVVDRAEKLLGFELPTLRYGVKRGWASPASPIWSNFGAGRGLPISCNGSYMADDMDSILWKVAEIGMMTKEGAGTSVYMGALRGFGSAISGGGQSEGPLHFARDVQEAYLNGEAEYLREQWEKTSQEIEERTLEGRLINAARDVQEQVTVVSQSNVRRGNAAIYIDIRHPDIERWMQIRSTAGGTHHPIQHLSFGICIDSAWMREMLAEGRGGEKRKLMAKIRNKRKETGFPYLFFTDNANEARPQVLKDLDLWIWASNLCTEVMLHSTANESFVCDLSSVNLLYYHEWKDTPFVREMIYLLDAVMTEYIEKTAGERLLADAHRFAVRWRAVGLGVLGYHSKFQSMMIPFESEEARALNIEMHKHLADESVAASRYLAEIFGEPEGMKGTGLRNLTVNALAPTTSSSIICGQPSQSIEPWDANIFENDNAKGVFTQRNVHLEELLESKGMNTTEVWTAILQAGGSVQHLDFLSDREKAVFKTFVEIDQSEIIRQAADRQPFIDQGQSLNLKLSSDATMKEDVDLIVQAWESGLKSLYYRKGTNKAQELARANAACVACEA